MSLFNWIFGKKRKLTLNIQVESSESDDSRADEVERQRIHEIKKESTVVKTEKGYLESVRFVTEYIENNDLHFRSYLSLMKKIIPYMVKAKEYSAKDFIGFMDKYRFKYTELERLENQIEFGHLYRKFDVKFGIRYLEDCASRLPAPQKGIADHFNLYAKLSEYYVDTGDGDGAFSNIRKAHLVNSDFDNASIWLSNHRRIAQLQVRRYAEGYPTPNNPEIIYYSSCVIALEFVRDVTSDTSCFLTFKDRCKGNLNYHFEHNRNFDSAINSLNLGNKIEDFLTSFNDYIFTKMPARLGIPESKWKYDSRQDYERARQFEKANVPTFADNPEGYYKYTSDRHEQWLAYNKVDFDVTIVFEDVKAIIKRTLTN